MSVRFTAKALSEYRAAQVVCELCGGGFTEKNPPVVDHDHSTGVIRGVLHRGCNSMLGIIENGRARYLLRDLPRLARVLRLIPEYISRRRDDGFLYPTHRTTDEKRELRNKRARAATAARRARNG